MVCKLAEPIDSKEKEECDTNATTSAEGCIADCQQCVGGDGSNNIDTESKITTNSNQKEDKRKS